MAADPYIQSAISQLQSAIADMQQQMNSVKQDAEHQKKQLQQEIDRAENERRTVEASLTQLPDDNQKHMMQDHANGLSRLIDEHRAHMSQIDSNTAAITQRKTGVYNNIQGLIHQLDSMLASPDLR